MSNPIQVKTYACGHIGEIPPFMGRGEARQVRLKEYFSKPCLECRKVAAKKQAEKLCVLLPGFDNNGKRNFRKYNAEEIAAYVAKVS